MKNTATKPEILAPAGSGDALKAAVYNGADAVYLGLSKFSARSKADNFTGESFPEALDFAHLYGVKVYVAMNTLVKDSEMNEAVLAAQEAWARGADAFIVQDLSFAERLRAEVPGIVLHASTQLGIHNAEGAEICKRLGFDRVILARETLIEDIRRIRDSVDIEVEAFVQGALCVAFSGNCYFSGLVSGYSGNRGKCMQLCRKSYRLNGCEGYYLSTKDICLLSRISELAEAGVCSFKIEGRMRRPEYVAEAVRVYRGAVDGQGQKSDVDALKRVYNRGNYCEAYLSDPTPDLIYPALQGHMGVKKGVVSAVKRTVAVMSCALRAGDGVKFLRNGKEIGSAKIARDGNETGFVGEIRQGDEVYLTTDAAKNREISARTKRLEISLTSELVASRPAALTAEYGEFRYRQQSDYIVPRAEGRPVTRAEMTESLTKTGETEFSVKECRVTADDDVFIPKSVLNALRRNALSGLKECILAGYAKKRHVYSGNSCTMSDILHESQVKNRFLWVQAEYAEQIPASVLPLTDGIVANPRDYASGAMEPFFRIGKPIYLNLPIMSRGADMPLLKNLASDERLAGIVVNNLYGLQLINDKPAVLGMGMNIINRSNLPHILSVESDEKPKTGEIFYIYGKPPVMTYAHCPHKSLGQSCANCSKTDLTIEDAYGAFSVRRYHAGYCYHQLLLNRPLNRTGVRAERILVDIGALTADEAERAVIAAAEGKSIPGGTRGNLNKTLY